MIYIGNFYVHKIGETITFQLITTASSEKEAREQFKERFFNPPQEDPVKDAIEELNMTEKELMLKKIFKGPADILYDLNKIYLLNILEVTENRIDKPIIINYNSAVSLKKINGNEVMDKECNIIFGDIPIGEETDAVRRFDYHKDTLIDADQLTDNDEESSDMDKLLADKMDNGDYPFVILKSSKDEEERWI